MPGPVDVLQDAPARIRKARADLWDAKNQLSRLELEEKGVEAAMYARVAAERVEGKPAHSNADARDAATRGRLREDPGWQDLRVRIRKQLQEVDRIQSAVEFYRDVQTNARVVMLATAPFSLVMSLDDAVPEARP